MEPVAHTDRGTPVYLIEDPPEDVVPESFKRRRTPAPPPRGPFAAWLASQIPHGACAIVHYNKRRVIQIFKVGKDADVFKITARSIKLEDRKRLVAEGILRAS